MSSVVIISGYFNPIHSGHLDYIQAARKLGDKLVVIVNNDEQVKLKDSIPFMDAVSRMQIVNAIKGVDQVVLSIDTDETVVETLKSIYSEYSVDYFCDSIVFANGGDRTEGNSPEETYCRWRQIKTAYNVGGGKTKSSSDLVSDVNTYRRPTQNIRVFGFPHSGTTVLRSILGHIDQVYEYPYESHVVTDEMTAEATRLKKDYILTKTPEPYYDEFFSDKTLEGFVQIFVIRNPYYVFSSINYRLNGFGDKEVAAPWYDSDEKWVSHSMGCWFAAAELYLKYKEQNPNNLHCIKYEDFFPNDYQNIRDILNSHDIPYSDEIFCNTGKNNISHDGVCYDDVKHFDLTVEDTVPQGKIHHADLRTWQVNQEFKNMNRKAKIHLCKGQLEILGSSPIVADLGYTNPLED